jgi:hypothetical protein
MEDLPFKIDMVQCKTNPSVFHYDIEVNLQDKSLEDIKVITAVIMWFWFGEGRIGDS